MTRQMIIHLSTLNCVRRFILYTGWYRMTGNQTSILDVHLFMSLTVKAKIQSEFELELRIDMCRFDFRRTS